LSRRERERVDDRSAGEKRRHMEDGEVKGEGGRKRERDVV
jgi:hypothetical protein